MNSSAAQTIRNFAHSHNRTIRYLRFQSFAISVIAALVMVIPMLVMNEGFGLLALPLIVVMMIVSNPATVFIVCIAPFLRWERYMIGKHPVLSACGFVIVAIIAPLGMLLWAISSIDSYSLF